MKEADLHVNFVALRRAAAVAIGTLWAWLVCSVHSDLHKRTDRPRCCGLWKRVASCARSSLWKRPPGWPRSSLRYLNESAQYYLHITQLYSIRASALDSRDVTAAAFEHYQKQHPDIILPTAVVSAPTERSPLLANANGSTQIGRAHV